jgi:hypothetical protein
MRLMDKGDTITVELTVPEAKVLDKAAKILRKIAKVPCDAQVSASDATESVETVLAALAPAKKDKAE